MGELYLIGAGTPTPTPERFGTSEVLRLGDDYLMFDCGPATTYKLVKAGLFPTQINYLFLTHHHFDHVADYPCFLLCRWDQSTGKERPLKVFGPEPTRAMTEKLIGAGGAFCADWTARCNSESSRNLHVNRGGTLPRPQPDYDVTDAVPGEVARGDGWKVIAGTVHHAQPWLESLAYRVETDAGGIVFSGDSGFCPELTQIADGADVLVAMCWDHQAVMNENGEIDGVLGTTDAARTAVDAGVKRLVLTHAGKWASDPASRREAITEVSEIYGGEIIFADELMKIKLW